MNLLPISISEKQDSVIEFSNIIDGKDDKPILESKEEFVLDHSEQINIDDI
jgi:hypothetical protein